MNAEKSTFSLLPAPMQKEKVVKEDGRFLYYYTFAEAPRPPLTGGSDKPPEDADV